MTEQRWSLDSGRALLDAAARSLVVDGKRAKLGGRAFDLLVALVANHDRVVPKQELLDLVWPGLVVEENNLQVQVLTLRRLLGNPAIATVPGRGYRFVAAVDDRHPAVDLPPARRATAGDGPLRERPSPPPAPTLIGRADDEAALVALLQTERLVTVLGSGGVGKSSLARAVVASLAPRFADGIAWVDLAPAGDAQGVIDAVAAAVGVSLPRGQRGRELAAALATARLLLVLDNAEHVLDAVHDVARSLCDAAPDVHTLVTSQASLRLGAEVLYRLEPLALPILGDGIAQAQQSPAVQLFVTRVRARDRHFVVDEHNAAAVVSIARQLDGLPLAIEMAAARVPALSPAQLDAALRERFRLLFAGDRSAPGRQRTLEAAMAWTHGLLGDSERTVFKRLAVFVGSFSLAAAQQVCCDEPLEPVAADVRPQGQADGAPALDEWQVLDALAGLVDRSLVAAPAGDPPRYRLLETPRAFAQRLLADEPAHAERLHRRHLAVYRQIFAHIHEDHLWVRQPVGEQLALAQPEADNGLAALAFALKHDPTEALALAPGLAQALVRRHSERFGVWRRTERLLADAVRMPAPTPAVMARWQLGYAQFWGVNSLQRSLPNAKAAAAQFRAEGHAAGEYRALAVIAAAAAVGGAQAGDVPPRSASVDRMRELEQPGWPADLRYLRLWVEANLLSAAGRHDEALHIDEQAAELVRASGRQGRLVHEMGTVYRELAAGHIDAAIEHALAAVQRLHARQRDALASGLEMLLLAAWLLRADDDSTARAGELAPAVWQAACAYDMQAGVADLLALLAARQGRPRAAVILAGYAEAAYQRLGTSRLPLYGRCLHEALAIAREQAGELSGLPESGAALADADLTRVAFAGADIA